MHWVVNAHGKLYWVTVTNKGSSVFRETFGEVPALTLPLCAAGEDAFSSDQTHSLPREWS